MKKHMLLLALLLVTSIGAFAIPKPIKRAISPNCNGSFNSRSVEFPDYTLIICSCNEIPGTCTPCPTSVSYSTGDGTDMNAAADLFSRADLQVALGKTEGVITSRYQVSGESSVRQYTVVWKKNPITGGIEQTFSRSDVPFVAQ